MNGIINSKNYEYLIGGKFSGGKFAILVTFGKSFNRKTFNRQTNYRNILNRRRILVILGVSITIT